jgi:hypothetical protein
LLALESAIKGHFAVSMARREFSQALYAPCETAD